MFCTKCGAELEEDAVFCSECGKKIEVVAKAVTEVEAAYIHTEKPVGGKTARRKDTLGTGFYLAALGLSVLLLLYFYLWKHFNFNLFSVFSDVFLQHHFKHVLAAGLVVLSCILLKASRIPAIITLILIPASQYIYIEAGSHRVCLIPQDMFVNIWSIAVFSAAIFFILTLICKGIAGRIVNVLLLSLSVFLTIYSLVLGVCRLEAGGYAFTRIASLGDPKRLPYCYPIVFLIYTVISIGMLSMKYAPQKGAADTGKTGSRRKKYVLSYVSGYTVAALMSVAVIILFIGANTIEKRTARIMEQGDGFYFEERYLAALSIYQAAFRLNPDDPDVYIAMLKASGKCLNPNEFLTSYDMAVDNLGRKDLKNITEKAWKFLEGMEDDFRDAGQTEDYWSLVYNFRNKVVASDVDVNLPWTGPVGYTTAAAPVPAATAADGLPTIAEPIQDSMAAVPEDDANIIDDYFRVDPITGFFTMDTGLFGKTFTEMSGLLGGLDPLEYWPHWGDNLYVTFLSDDVNTYALLFQNNAFVCCYYDIPEDGRIPDNISTAAVGYFGKECDSITNPYGDGFTYFYNWILPGYYYEQYNESYFDETHFRQRYSTIQFYPM